MKKTVKVVIEKEFEIEIDDKLLTEEALKEFSSYMWEVTTPDDLFKYAARMCCDYADFIEGLGPTSSIHSDVKSNVKWEELYEDVEAEILEGEFE